MVYTLSVPYVYDYITKFCKKQAEIIQNQENENVCNTGQGESSHLAAVTCRAVQVSRLPWQREQILVGHKLLY
jgi:hypothetical protein